MLFALLVTTSIIRLSCLSIPFWESMIINTESTSFILSKVFLIE